MPIGDGPSLHFTLPVNNSACGRTLKVGRGLSIYWDLQPPNIWPETTDSYAKLMLALEATELTARWSADGSDHLATSIDRHVWFVPSNTPHSADWRGTGAMLMILVDDEMLRQESGRELRECRLASLTPFIQQNYLLGEFCRRFQELCHGRRRISDTVALAEGTLVFAALLESGFGRFVASADGSRQKGLNGVQLGKVAHFVDLHLRENLNPAKLGQAAGLSEHHFSRLFQHTTGFTPMKYVWRCRLHRARQLLESGEWKVAAAAAEAGFCDQSHLDRHFRSEFGCSPGSVIPIARGHHARHFERPVRAVVTPGGNLISNVNASA